jgi:hypothetical protein
VNDGPVRHALLYGAAFLSAVFVVAFLLKVDRDIDRRNRQARRDAVNATLADIDRTAQPRSGNADLADIPQELSVPEFPDLNALPAQPAKPPVKTPSDVVAFEEALRSVENMADESMAKQGKVLDQWLEGQVSSSYAHEITVRAKDQCFKISREMLFIGVPDKLPKDAQDMLARAAGAMSSAYLARSEALGVMLEFINTARPEYLAKFKEGMRRFREQVSSATLDIIEAKRIIGFGAGKEGSENGISDACGLRVEAISYSDTRPFVFIGGEIHRIGDIVCARRIIRISPDKIAVSFKEQEFEYGLGDVIE